MRRVAHTGLEGGLVSAALYSGLLAWLFLAPPLTRGAPSVSTTRIRLVAPRRDDVPPSPPPSPPPPPRPRRMQAARAPAPDAPVAPAPLLAPAAPAATPPPVSPRRFAVSMEATVPGGGVAVPVAGAGTRPATRATPGAAGEGPEAPAFALEPDAGPALLSQPDPAEMRSLYPEAARRGALEGDVKLELLVSETGEVVEVKVVRSAGSGFDEVAERLVRRFRFRPAVRAGRPVPARIPWTYKFRLEG